VTRGNAVALSVLGGVESQTLHASRPATLSYQRRTPIQPHNASTDGQATGLPDFFLQEDAIDM